MAEGRVAGTLVDEPWPAAHETFTLAFSPDSRLLAAGDWNPSVRLWDTSTKRALALLEGHRNGVPSIAFAPDGKTVASGSWDHTVKLWNVTTREEMLTLKGFAANVNALAFSPDGNTLATVSTNGTVQLWRAASFAETDAAATTHHASR